MNLLFITQKLTGQDAFGVLWVRAFIAMGYRVTVLCLEASPQRYEFGVCSMGKERGLGKLRQILEFERALIALPCDRVFLHMSPVWAVAGMWWWMLKRVPVYLWYTHYRMQLGVRLVGWFGKRFFCATAQSLPQYENSPKKVVVGHGIDLAFWPQRRNRCNNPYRLLAVHRLSRSKRVDIALRALALLPARYTLDIYGIEAEPDYLRELKTLVEELKLRSRVTFHASMPMDHLQDLYTRHCLNLNMASATIDKTMLEAMTCGCYPVTTQANAEAIGIPLAPENDSPQAVAAFIQRFPDTLPMSPADMYRVVAERHSLEGLVAKMDAYIREGI